MSEEIAVVDTVIVEPEERRISLLARAETELTGGPTSLGRIVFGELSEGMRRAIEKNKVYPWSRGRRGVG